MKSTVETRDKILDRNNRLHTFFKIGFLKISQYSQERACVGACDFIKKNLQHRYFPVKFAKFLRALIFYRKPTVAASLWRGKYPD